MIHICFSAERNCYAPGWTYGEICVGSNCCGQFGKGLKMWEARLNYNEEQLKGDLNFDSWHEGFEELQRLNKKANISFDRKRIRDCRRMIKYFKSKTL